MRLKDVVLGNIATLGELLRELVWKEKQENKKGILKKAEVIMAAFITGSYQHGIKLLIMSFLWSY